MLRLPSASNTHATLSPFGEAIRSDGNGELITCASVKPLPLTSDVANTTKKKESRATLSRRQPFIVPPIRAESGGRLCQMVSLIRSDVKPCQVRWRCSRKYERCAERLDMQR